MIPSKRKSFLLRDISLNHSVINFILYALFFCSGCSALIYQIMWQRLLFTVFGVDLVSVTIIVAVFMFGLGMGGLWGGYLAERLSTKLLMLYGILELGIAIFGFLSPELIEMIGNTFFNSSRFVTTLVSFLMLLIPTLLMGASFPILVTYVNKVIQNVGYSVGALYLVNALGGAMGAYFSGFVLLYTLDITGAINRAAYLNLAIVIVTLIVFRRANHAN